MQNNNQSVAHQPNYLKVFIQRDYSNGMQLGPICDYIDLIFVIS